MAKTLVEMAKLSTDVLQKGVIETIYKDSPILQRVQFKEIEGNSHLFNRETTQPTTSWYAVGDTWTESTGTVTQSSVALQVLGGDSDTDNFGQKTRSNYNDQRKENIEAKSKAVRHEFERAFIYGGTTTTSSTKEMDGLMKLIAEVESSSETTLDGLTNDCVYACHGTSATVTLDFLDILIDRIFGGKPDCFITSKPMRRKITSLARAVVGWEYGTDELGNQVHKYAGIPIYDNDFIKDNMPDNSTSVCDIGAYVYATTRTTAVENTPIFAVKFSPKDICGVQSGGLTVENLGSLETKDATRVRIKWYCGLALFGTISSVCVMTGATYD